MKKTFVLDISTLLAFPNCILSFDEHDIILLDRTVEQMRDAAQLQTEHGSNARQVLMLLDELRESGNLWEGVLLPGGGTLRIYSCDIAVISGDPLIQFCETHKTILVSSDIGQRIRADKSKIIVQEYKTDAAKVRYDGRRELIIPDAAIDEFYGKEKLLHTAEIDFGEQPPIANEFFLLRSDSNPKKTALARFESGNFVPLVYGNEYHPYGVEPKNIGQKFAIEALMMPAEVAPLVLLIGPAGTAKTFLSMAVGLEQVVNTQARAYHRILAVRPNAIMDKEIGFLPGDERDKISPLFRPIFDNLETLTRTESGKDDMQVGNYANMLMDRGDIEMQALGYMRGRSISDTYMILDEMQNSTPIQAFGLISRAGDGTKIVMCGDSEQIDNPQLDRLTNGLMYANDRMKGSPLCWTVTFTADECVRSKLAMEAISRMAPKGSL